MTPHKISRYGWKPDPPDPRDLLLAPAPTARRTLPPSVSLRYLCGKPFNQLDLGSCTANALAKAYFVALVKGGFSTYDVSRLFVYYFERFIEGTVDEDAGAALRDGCRVLRKQGAPPEALWPYDPARYAERPSDVAIAGGEVHQVVQYLRVRQSITAMKACLADGFPFVGGFAVPESFESDEVARTGVMPAPKPGEPIVGWHATLWTGYDDTAGTWEVLNSWDESWGDGGWFHMPQPYAVDRATASDFWTVRVIEG